MKTLIWTAIAAYDLVAIVRKRLQCTLPLYAVLQMPSVSLFEKVPLSHLLTTFDTSTHAYDDANQLQLVDC